MNIAAFALLLNAAPGGTNGDILERFIRSLSPEIRPDARETMRLVDEFTAHTKAMLAAETGREAIAHASWIQTHVHAVGYRWSALVNAARRWAELDVMSLTIRPKAEREEPIDIDVQCKGCGSIGFSRVAGGSLPSEAIRALTCRCCGEKGACVLISTPSPPWEDRERPPHPEEP